jgi:hypothetical protein
MGPTMGTWGINKYGMKPIKVSERRDSCLCHVVGLYTAWSFTGTASPAWLSIVHAPLVLGVVLEPKHSFTGMAGC